MRPVLGRAIVTAVPTFVLIHRHSEDECGVAFAAWAGVASPLRHHPALASCLTGDHRVWWTVEAPSGPDALALLPDYVAQRTEAIAVHGVMIP